MNLILLRSPDLFRVGQLLARGSTGEVFAATLLGVPVALKVAARPESSLDLTDRGDAAARLEVEARVLQRIPATTCKPRLIAHGTFVNSDGLVNQFLAETRIWGHPLLEAVGFLPAASANELSLACFGALAELHKLGVAQVDLHPNNLLLEISQRPLKATFVDFEYAKVDADDHSLEMDLECMWEVVARAVWALGLSINEAEKVLDEGIDLYTKIMHLHRSGSGEASLHSDQWLATQRIIWFGGDGQDGGNARSWRSSSKIQAASGPLLSLSRTMLRPSPPLRTLSSGLLGRGRPEYCLFNPSRAYYRAVPFLK